VLVEGQEGPATRTRPRTPNAKRGTARSPGLIPLVELAARRAHSISSSRRADGVMPKGRTRTPNAGWRIGLSSNLHFLRTGQKGTVRAPREETRLQRNHPLAECRLLRRAQRTPGRPALRRPVKHRHIESMATYTVIPAPADRGGFDVEIVGSDGTRQIILSFETQEDAEAWIVEDARRDEASDRRGFRMQWRF
jgi:hypothetical protein